jgi:hypothetical protein
VLGRGKILNNVNTAFGRFMVLNIEEKLPNICSAHSGPSSSAISNPFSIDLMISSSLQE